MTWRRGRSVVVGALLLAVAPACDGDAGGAGTPSAQVTADRESATTPTVADDVDVTDPAVRDALFLTAVDEVLADTAYAGMVDEAPGDFLVAADGLCARLTQGEDMDTVLEDVLDAIQQVRSDVGDDDAQLAGAVLGAGVQVYCPEHVDRLPEEVGAS